MRFDHRADILLAVVEHVVRTEAADEFRLFRRVDRGDDLRPHLLGELNRRQSDAAGSRLHVEDVARLHAAGLLLQVEVDRAPYLRQRGRFNHREPFRNRDDHARRHRDLLRIAAAAEQGAGCLTAAFGNAADDGMSGFHVQFAGGKVVEEE